jgi:hypothetical protein
MNFQIEIRTGILILFKKQKLHSTSNKICIQGLFKKFPKWGHGAAVQPVVMLGVVWIILQPDHLFPKPFCS